MQTGQTTYAIKAAIWFALVYGGTGWIVFSIFHDPAQAWLVSLCAPLGLLAAHAILYKWRRYAPNADIWAEYPVFLGVMLGGLFMFGSVAALSAGETNMGLAGGVIVIWLIPAMVVLTFGYTDLEAVQRIGMGLSPYSSIGCSVSQKDYDSGYVFPDAAWNIGKSFWVTDQDDDHDTNNNCHDDDKFYINRLDGW